MINNVKFLEFDLDRVSKEFIINKENRTVVCIIKTINDIPHRLAKYGLIDAKYNDEDFDVRIYKGIAKCAIEDTWDEIYGKQLAEYRAARARQIDVNEELKIYFNTVLRNLGNLNKFGFLKLPHKPNPKLRVVK